MRIFFYFTKYKNITNSCYIFLQTCNNKNRVFTRNIFSKIGVI